MNLDVYAVDSALGQVCQQYYSQIVNSPWELLVSGVFFLFINSNNSDSCFLYVYLAVVIIINVDVFCVQEEKFFIFQ